MLTKATCPYYSKRHKCLDCIETCTAKAPPKAATGVRRRAWQPEDDAKLLELRKTETMPQIAIILDRTEEACKSRLRELRKAGVAA